MNRIKTGWLAFGTALVLAGGTMAGVSTSSIAADAEMAAPSTAEQHGAEAAKYEAEARDLEAKAERHKNLATSYRARASGGDKQSASLRSLEKHCKNLAKAYAAAAAEAREMAKMHREMSNSH